jgi:ketosteroid isomerase-like protein
MGGNHGCPRFPPGRVFLPLVGKDAIKKMHQSYFDQYKFETSTSDPAVKVSGDLGTARATWIQKLIPKAEGDAPIADQGNYAIVFSRQGDGSCKWDSCIVKSDQPMSGTTADGVEERELIRIEKDWMQAMLKSDAAAFEKFLAKEWIMDDGGQVTSRAQMLADFRSGAYKIESLQLSDVKPHVYGNAALIKSTVSWKANYKGKDLPNSTSSIDFFVKRDGKWLAISTQNLSSK